MTKLSVALVLTVLCVFGCSPQQQKTYKIEAVTTSGKVNNSWTIKSYTKPTPVYPTFAGGYVRQYPIIRVPKGYLLRVTELHSMTKRAKPEAELEADLVTWCESKGWLCLKLTNTARRGFPDRTIIGSTFVAFIELKAPGGKLSHHQRETIGTLRDLGANVLVSDSLEECKNWLAKLEN